MCDGARFVPVYAPHVVVVVDPSEQQSPEEGPVGVQSVVRFVVFSLLES
jgi:hypothetical protein